MRGSAPWFAGLREKAGDGSTDFLVEVRQSDLTRLVGQLADREAILDAIERAIYGDIYGASRDDFLAEIAELKRATTSRKQPT